jgi:hypothetical protein
MRNVAIAFLELATTTLSRVAVAIFLDRLLAYTAAGTTDRWSNRASHKMQSRPNVVSRTAVMEDSAKIGLNNVFTREKFSTSLLDPPSGMVWVRGDYDCHEWSLVDTDMAKRNSPLPSPCSTGTGAHCDNAITVEGAHKVECHKQTIGNDNNIHHVIEHVVLPTDTFPGICLAYKISAIRLRQLNRFSGANLALAPRKLLIPVSRSNRSYIKLQDHNCKEFKLYGLLAEVPRLSKRSAQAYLTMAKFDLCQAIHDANSDLDWEGYMMQQVRDDYSAGRRISKNCNFKGENFCPTSILNTSVPCNQNQKRNEELLEKTSMDTETLKQMSRSTLMLGYNCGEEIYPLPCQIFFRKIEDPRMQLSKALLLEPGLAISNLWFHLIAFLKQPNNSPRLVEYEMNELNRDKA